VRSGGPTYRCWGLEAHSSCELRLHALGITLFTGINMKPARSFLCSLVLILGLMVPTSGRAQQWSGIISPSRATDWSSAGVEGGIPSAGWTQCGSTIAAGSTAATINSALSGCGTNQYVLLGPGTFSITGLQISKNNVVLRGSGPDQTFLIVSSEGPVSCRIGSFSGAIDICTNNNSQTVVNWTAGYSQGTTQITLSSVSGLTVGSPIILEQLDDGSDGWPATGDLYVCDSTANNCSNKGAGSASFAPDGDGRSNMEIVRATAINQGGCGATCVTINPPITLPNYRSSQSPHAVFYASNVYVSYSGIENLSVDGTVAGGGIKMVYCDNCWVKNVRAVDTAAGGTDIHVVTPVLSFHVEIRDNYFYGDQCAAGCINNYQTMPVWDGSMLWQNNIQQGIQASMIPNGGPYSNSVLAYNFFVGRPDSAVVLHNAGEMMNLVEGNIMPGWDGDVVHGTHFMETIFRNALVSYKYAAGAGTVNVAIQALTNNRFINVVGNVMGHPHFTNYESDLANDGNAVYILGWQGNNSGTALTSDTNVKRTMMRWGNWDSVTNATRWCGNSSDTGWSLTCASTSEVPSGITNFANPVPTVGDAGIGQPSLPASFYLSSRPSWWPSTKPWPAIGPDVTGGNITGMAGHAYTIPAADCYLNLLGGAVNGSGGPLNFNASTCYPSVVAVGPPPPSNLQAVVK
jgi:hypothetical protein